MSRPCVHLSVALDGRVAAVPPSYPRPVRQIIARGGIRGMGVLERRAPGIARRLYWGAVYPSLLTRRARRMAATVAALRPHRVAVFLNAVEVPLVAEALLGELDVPYVTMEWDLLDEALERGGLTAGGVRRAMRRLEALRRAASARGVASEGMAALYRREWGLDTLVLRQPVTPAAFPPATPSASGPFTIALCGNLYAVDEFRALLSGLDRLGWVVGGRRVAVRIVGAVPPDLGALPDRVSVTGWVDFDASLAGIAGADLGYCPYWFDEGRRRITSTSFPSKLISYLSCGVPVLYHGPREGTPALFLARHPAGICVHSLDPAAIAAALTDFAAEPARAVRARQAAAAAVAGELSSRTLRDRLARWLDDDPAGAGGSACES